MSAPLALTAETLHVGTTVCYRFRHGSSLGTVVDRTDRTITLLGPACDGRFTHDQIDTLLSEGVLTVVLTERQYLPTETLRAKRLTRGGR